MGESIARWLDREAAANYLSVRVDELPRLVRDGKIPRPSLHFGPRTPRWDRHSLDETMGASASGPARRAEIDAALAALAADPPNARWRKARRKAQA